LARVGLPATLLTDDPELAEHPGANFFSQRIVAVADDANLAPADDITTTRMARLFALAIDFLERANAPFVLWIHAKGMRAAWDAPLSFREKFRDEGDPPTSLDTAPAIGQSSSGYDPEELLPYVYAYAGQVALIDMCLDSYLDAVAAVAERGPLLHMLTASRGYPLGDHRVIGLDGSGLYEELLHVPLFVQFPDRLGAGQRTQQLIQPADLFATMADILCSESSKQSATRGLTLAPLATNERAPWRRHALSVSGDQACVRTRYWSLLRNDAVELYLKPDDRWEVNEIASRLPQVVADMTTLLEEARQAAGEDTPLNEAAVSSDLFEPPPL
jgi:arylsulfatase A-like enzyme